MQLSVVTSTQPIQFDRRIFRVNPAAEPIPGSFTFKVVGLFLVFLLSHVSVVYAQPKAGAQPRQGQAPTVAPKDAGNRRLEAEDRRRLRQDIRTHVEEMRAKSLVLPAKNTNTAAVPPANVVYPAIPVVPAQPALTTPAVSQMPSSNPHGLSPQERVQLRQQIKEQPKYWPTPTEVDR
jgi:hypothetical protein